ncbi:MAG: hypothetical protein FJX84_03470 [Bacteroidetes bacterium]|nr:hypothetical protein [Bacteroidota bacterium]
METITIIFTALISSGGVITMAYYLLKRETDREKLNLQLELRKSRQEYFLPSRVESYQRAILLLERIHPNSLIMRIHNPGLSARAMQAELLKTIREEYDHNVAQQLFISPKGWKMLKDSKDETIKIINIAGNQMIETAVSTDLATKIFELVSEIGELPTEITVEFLKQELQDLF